MSVKMGEDIVTRREDIARSQPFNTGSTERVRRLNALLLSRRHPGVCLHRARAYTEVFAEMEDQPVEIRFATAFAKTLHSLPAVIADGELLVGSPTCHIRYSNFIPEIAGTWLRNEIDNLSHRKWDPLDVRPEQVTEIKEILKFWNGKTLYDVWSKACPSELVTKVKDGWVDCWPMLCMHGYHWTPPWEMILSEGLSGYEARVKRELKSLDSNSTETMGKHPFYEALLIIIDGIKDFAKKYSDKAVEMAEAEEDPQRKAELYEISKIMSQVPYYGARSFREAIQVVGFIMVLLHIEGTGAGYTIGRLDQFLYPYYKADIDNGVLTRQSAQELVELLFLKLTGIVMLWSEAGARSSPGYKPTQTMSICGVDREGRDATNELSYICLDAAESVRTIQPDIVILCHPRETPYAIKMRGAELNALGLGVPKFINTETIKSELLDVGYTLEESMVGWIQGCSEPEGPNAKQYGLTAGCVINLPVALEYVLFNGYKHVPGQVKSKKLLGLRTGDPSNLSTFEDLVLAVKRQLAQQILDGHVATSWVEWVAARHFPLLFQSILTDACIERGLPATAGGAKIYVGPGQVMGGGLATLADSLAVIKKLVFEEKKVKMADLVQALDANFEGYEILRDTFINKVPKFGNDEEYVDQIAKDIFNFASAEVKKHTTVMGNKNFAITAGPMSYMAEGTKTWATPDGRKAGEPFSIHIGPTDGRDVNGVLASINSATKMDHDRQFGITHNLYLVNVDSEAKLHDMINLIDYFFNRGGHHLQINCQDKQVLVDAKKHPEKYRGLMIRVAGYVAYFVELPEELQEQIINRTSHCV